MDDQVRKVLHQLISRRDPKPSVLLDVERLGSSGVDAICELLRSGSLAPRQQDRALQGLAYASKHAGQREQTLVLQLALEHIAASDIGLRSRAAHMAVATASILARRDPSKHGESAEMLQRVATAVREAARLGLHSPASKLVQDFLSEFERNGLK